MSGKRWCSIWKLRLPDEDVEQLAAGQVGRAEQLAVVPLAAGLVRRLLLGELLRAVGEVPAEDDRERPQVAGQVRGRVAGQRERRRWTGQQREQDVVLQRLLADLAPDRADHVPLLAEARLAGGDALDLEVVQRDAVLEEGRQQGRVERVAQVVRVPRLVLGHAQHAVADVAVLADDVGVGVVHVVVRVAPLVAGAGGVPLEALAAQARGPSSSRTGRASRCGRSPCCRGSSTATGPSRRRATRAGRSPRTSARGRRPRARAGPGSPCGCSRRRARRGRRRRAARIASSSSPKDSICSGVRLGMVVVLIGVSFWFVVRGRARRRRRGPRRRSGCPLPLRSRPRR